MKERNDLRRLLEDKQNELQCVNQTHESNHSSSDWHCQVAVMQDELRHLRNALQEMDASRDALESQLEQKSDDLKLSDRKLKVTLSIRYVDLNLCELDRNACF